MRRYSVSITGAAKKLVRKMPDDVKDRFALLVDDIAANGPVRHDWPNFSMLGENRYHCHLKHKWVACWKWVKGTFEVEVYYAGSREDAPY